LASPLACANGRARFGGLSPRPDIHGAINADGEVAEWSNAPHSKCGLPATVTWVRIPPSPPVILPQASKKRLFFLIFSHFVLEIVLHLCRFSRMHPQRLGAYLGASKRSFGGTDAQRNCSPASEGKGQRLQALRFRGALSVRGQIWPSKLAFKVPLCGERATAGPGCLSRIIAEGARDRKCDARSTARVTACVGMPICCPSTSGPTPLLHHLRPSSPGVADAHRNMEAPLKPTENPNRKVGNFTLPLPGNFTVPLTL
jgi:hypothetical protein